LLTRDGQTRYKLHRRPEHLGMHRRRAAGAAPFACAVLAIGGLLLAGCGAAAPQSPGEGSAAARAASTGNASGAKPVWLQSLQMVSPRAGWALLWTGDPNGAKPVSTTLGRTGDGGRTWTGVMPRPAAAMLASSNSSAVLVASTASRAWLAVTKSNSQSGYRTRNLTEVFATSTAGRSWTTSAPIRAPGNARLISFTDQRHGWLLQDLGAAMQQNAVQLYRTTDGQHWSEIAATPPPGQTGVSGSGLPVFCDKSGLAFATSRIGWITADCNVLPDSVLVSRDGGAHWAAQQLPVPGRTCQYAGCTIVAPQFFGAIGFLTVGNASGPAYLLDSHNAGASWTKALLPPGHDMFPQIRFFDASHGLAIPAGAQGSIGRVFYLTSDGGRTWRPIRQAGPTWQPGTTIQFVSPNAGFGWNMNARTPAVYATVNGGRSWTRFVPLG